ncbi:MAG: hypothetical protein ACXVRE_00070 [Gaiellaceae bacterium]
MGRRWVTASLAAGILVAAALLARILLVREVAAPWIMPDELEYSELAKSFAAGGHFLFRGQPTSIFSLYPVLISPAWRAGSMHTTYELAKTINVVLMTAAVVPFYLWARRLAPGWPAVVGTALFLALPSFAYTGTLMTENASFPLVLLAFFAIALMLERPTLVRQVLVLAAIALACTVRFQSLVLFLVLVAAIVFKLALDLSGGAVGRSRSALWQAVRRYWLVASLLIGGAVAYGLLKLAEGQSLTSGLRTYATTAQVHYSIRDVLRWSVYHAGELALAVGLIPAFAFVVLLGLFRSRWQATAAERAYLAVTLAAIPLILVEVGAFASRYSLRIEERNSFYLEPLLLLALVIWLARGLPRPAALSAIGVAVVVGLLITIPFESLFNVSAETDTFGLVPFLRLAEVVNGGVTEVRTLIGIGAICAGVLFAALPRSVGVWAVPAVVGAFLILSSGSVFAKETYIAGATRHAGGLAGDPSWIDHAVGRNARVEFLYTTDIDVDQHILWQSEIWNRSVRRVFGVTSQDPSLPDVTAPLDPRARIVPQLPAGSPDATPRYVVAAANLDVAGSRIASSGALALYRVRPPLRLATLTTGVTADSWTGSSAAYTHYLPAGPHAHVVVAISRPQLSGPPPAQVSVTAGRLGVVNGTETITRVWDRQSWTLANGATHHFYLPLRRAPFQVQLAVSPTFVPSQYGSPDTRTLGVQVSFSYYR